MVPPHEGSESKAAAVTLNIFYAELMNNRVLNSILFLYTPFLVLRVVRPEA